LGKRLVETVTSGSEYHLLTDGKQIYLENSANEIVDILKNARQPIMSICLSDAVRQIHGEIHSEVRATAGEVPAPRRRPRSAEQAARQSGAARVKRRAGWQ
jgi:hypothetical protein